MTVKGVFSVEMTETTFFPGLMKPAACFSSFVEIGRCTQNGKNNKTKRSRKDVKVGEAVAAYSLEYLIAQSKSIFTVVTTVRTSTRRNTNYIHTFTYRFIFFSLSLLSRSKFLL